MTRKDTWLVASLLALVLMMGCREIRYTENAPEIDSYKRLNQAIADGDHSIYPEIYADTAKIYWNSTSPLTWQQAVEGMMTSLEAFSEYSYSEQDDYEFVTTDNGEQWVSWWSVFRGTLKESGLQVEVPIHTSARFIDGKIVEESGYWDNQIITDAMQSHETEETSEE